jgi:hypothetical protein
MNIIILTLVVWCLFDPTEARSRENSNVLVPNNDVNFQAKIKNLLNDDEVDRDDFSENEIESFNAIKNPKIEKLFAKKMEKENKVFDDINKNNEENKIDRDVKVISNVPSSTDVIRNSTEVYEPSVAFQNLSTSDDDSTPSTFFPINDGRTETETKSTSSPIANITILSVVPIDNGADWSTRNNRNVFTTPVYTEFSQSVNNNSSSSPQMTTSTSITTDKSFSTATSMITSTPIYDDFQADECILGKAERNLLWVDNEGNILRNFITANHGFVKVADLSRQFSNMSDYHSFAGLIPSKNEFHVSFDPYLALKKIAKSYQSVSYHCLLKININKQCALSKNKPLFSKPDSTFE